MAVQSTEGPDPDVIVLIPAHSDPAQTSSAQERAITLSLARRLHDLLAAHSFKVIVADSASEDQQIELANRSHASACLLLHATRGGHGVHVYTSALTATPPKAPARAEPQRTLTPWDTTQATALTQSLDLAGDVATSLNGIRLPLVTGRASVAPIDSLNCAAVALELAPYTPDHAATLEPGDADYQQRIAEAATTALLFRREGIRSAGHSQTPSAYAEPAR